MCPQTENVAVFAAGLRCPHSLQLPYVDKTNHALASYPASFGFAPVTIDGRARTLVVVRIAGKEDWLLLTSDRIRAQNQAAQTVLAYLKRWGNEETTRCLKQCTKLEDVRVRSDVSLRRMAVFAMIALGHGS